MMNQKELVHISDCTLMEAEQHFELSFREKIELCRIVDKLGVDTINLYQIRHKKTDRLLVKSICSAVKNASVAVPVDLKDPDSISVTWEALKEAVNPCLQVSVPVSSVQMEYLLHMKPEKMLLSIENTLKECVKLTDNVELIVQDATRSDPAFLESVIRKAAAAGAKTITLCDTAGQMMPEEIYHWITNIREQLPDIAHINLGFFCSGELNMADASAVSAVKAGVREIKTVACNGNAISLANIIRILNVRGGTLGVYTRVGVEQIRRIISQVEMICHSSDRKPLSTGNSEDDKGSDLMLSIHDSIETIILAAEKLGYDLNPDDQQKVWKSFCQTAEKKEKISMRELDAIIAAEAMQVPPAYHDIHYIISTGNETGAMSRMRLMFHSTPIEGIASGDGAIDAAFNAIEQATGRHFELDDFQIRSVTEGREAMGETVVRLRCEGKLYSGRGISTDIVGAGIMAYLNAVNKIVYEEEEA